MSADRKFLAGNSITDPRVSAFIRRKQNNSRYCTRNAVTNCTPLASLTWKMVPPPNGTDPTSALALPCALVVTLASVVHGTCVPTKHTAVLKVWLGSAPLE